jgi:hypothetical protein
MYSSSRMLDPEVLLQKVKNLDGADRILMTLSAYAEMTNL